eukprot:2418556-Prymnesium_polylepis.1
MAGAGRARGCATAGRPYSAPQAAPAAPLTSPASVPPPSEPRAALALPSPTTARRHRCCRTG